MPGHHGRGPGKAGVSGRAEPTATRGGGRGVALSKSRLPSGPSREGGVGSVTWEPVRDRAHQAGRRRREHGGREGKDQPRGVRHAHRHLDTRRMQVADEDAG